MRTSVCLGGLLGLLVSGVGAALSPPLPPLPVKVVPSSSISEGQASPELLARCNQDLEQVVRKSRSAPQRARALLAGLRTSCEALLPLSLREGAWLASSLRGTERAQQLRDAATSFVPEVCLAESLAMARAVEERCPPPEGMGLKAPLPSTFDAGSYVYALALYGQLRARGAYSAQAERWVHEFTLRSAVEAEASK